MSACGEPTTNNLPCIREAGHTGRHSANAAPRPARPAGMTTETVLRVPVPDDVLAWLTEASARNDRSPEMQVRNILRRLAADKKPPAGNGGAE